MRYTQKAVVRPNCISVETRDLAARVDTLRKRAIAEGGATRAQSFKCNDIAFRSPHETLRQFVRTKEVACDLAARVDTRCHCIEWAGIERGDLTAFFAHEAVIHRARSRIEPRNHALLVDACRKGGVVETHVESRDITVVVPQEAMSHNAQICVVTCDLAARVDALWEGTDGTSVKCSDRSVAVSYEAIMTGVCSCGLAAGVMLIGSAPSNVVMTPLRSRTNPRVTTWLAS